MNMQPQTAPSGRGPGARTRGLVHPGREERRARILALLRERRIKSQDELRKALRSDGHAANQATLSRDLRDMGVLKGPEGYALPSEVPAGAPAADPMTELYRAVRSWLESAIPALNQLVLRTPPGGASPLAVALDDARLSGVLGTVAGDDTVLVICASPRASKRLARELLALDRVATGGRR